MTFQNYLKITAIAYTMAGESYRDVLALLAKRYGEENKPSLGILKRWILKKDEILYPDGSPDIWVITCFPYTKYTKKRFMFAVAVPLQDIILAAYSSETAIGGAMAAISVALFESPTLPKLIIFDALTLYHDAMLADFDIGKREVIESLTRAKVLLSYELDTNCTEYPSIIKFLNRY